MKDNLKSYTQIDQIPGVSVVVIGLNVENFISSCLQAIYDLDYPRAFLEVIYVDSGSNDKTLDILKRFPSVKVIKLGTNRPNAAKGRNAGWRAATHDLVQFVDADSYLDPRWLRKAIPQLGGDVAAIAGTLKERFPNRNLYHRMANLEWNIRIGSTGWSVKDIEAKTFGGNVLIRREILENTGGFDQNLAAGEDPDLSYRIRRMGYKIFRLNSLMATHDINISSLSTFLKRTRRSGFVYGHLALRYWREPERYMVKRSIAILTGAAAPFFILILSALLGYLGPGILLSLLLMFRLVFQAGHFSKVMNIPFSEAVTYSLYLAFCIFPQFVGVVDSLRSFGLLKTRHKRVKEYQRVPELQRITQNI
jgi:glycosyltransferase involved in cell wall biosynthesis